MSENAESAIHDLMVANRILANEGVVDAFGHISVRNPDNAGRYFLACSRSPGLVTEEDIIEFELDSNRLDNTDRAIYAERFIHGCIYKARPDVMSVCHSHAHAVVPQPAPAHHTGLYHFAIKYPSRRDLATVVRRVIDAGVPLQGVADHGVSEAVYLTDVDGNGIELYRDRPQAEWPRAADGGVILTMADPLDLDALLKEAE